MRSGVGQEHDALEVLKDVQSGYWDPWFGSFREGLWRRWERESLISPPFFFLATQRDCIPRPHRDRSGCMTQFNGMRVKIMCMVFAPEKPLVQLC